MTVGFDIFRSSEISFTVKHNIFYTPLNHLLMIVNNLNILS
ncbi:hypothetical protein MTBPR1_140033 [Candidatus Terasakiella magnetica]|uniref:Uncharacterized protein n=1 Tax=Candidatus Terasakiella magnetica TaxID=1867952 RepID=A0A1C3RF82_9PROT|nr:hypothetical protein MTBPR1_140033 [Candidatus Terasakiella magnetica]